LWPDVGRRDSFPARALTGVHVLVVDDDADARDLIRAVLQYGGALVSAVASAEAALAVIERLTPDVLVVDIAMPERDGYWLIDAVRARPSAHGRGIPAVAITAHRQPHGPDRTLSAGFQAHLGKPIDPWEMCRVIASLARAA
jgi:CheY-like chemotaxis protein